MIWSHATNVARADLSHLIFRQNRRVIALTEPRISGPSLPNPIGDVIGYAPDE